MRQESQKRQGIEGQQNTKGSGGAEKRVAKALANTEKNPNVTHSRLCHIGVSRNS